MSKKHFDFIDKLLAKMLDLLARKSMTLTISQKRRFAMLMTKLIMPFKFSRKDYVKNIMMETLNISQNEAEKLRSSCYENFVLNSMEMAKLKYISDEEVLNLLEVDGYEHLEEAYRKGNGVIIMSGHFGLWEYIPQWAALKGYKVTTVVRRQNNKYADQWFEEMRRAHKGKTTDSGMGLREILRALKNGYVLGLMMDQDNGKKGIFVKFLNKWCSAPVGPAMISLKMRTPIVPLFIVPNYKGKHYFKIYPPLYPENYENTVEGQQKLTADYTELYEQLVRKYPEQWFWLHRRWKTQPEDCPENPWVKRFCKQL
ncbi:MAG: lysophospholipid acyltransferase family protein [Candidatus Riflebacteria bacterium]|nr:lysophospholipid acyltransferase family protein [Candidatus Riflebacteria bacterium]